MLTVDDKHMLGGRTLRVRRQEHKPVTKERMSRVEDLGLGQTVLREGAGEGYEVVRSFETIDHA